MLDADAVKELSYTSTNPLRLEILMADEDIFKDVVDLGSISAGLDYPRFNTYRTGEFTFTLSDKLGDYAVNNDNNFFVRNGHDISGLGVPVEVRAGYGDARVILFKGTTLDLTQNTANATIEIAATNVLELMHRTEINDFGLEKQFRLELSDEQDLNGIYPISDWVLPPSNESVNVYKRVSAPLTQVQELQTRGHLSPDNYAITSRGVETEGGAVAASTGYPQISMKAPYRYKDISFLLPLLLEKVGITDYDIELPDIDVGNHFSSNGRIGYDVIGTNIYGTGNPISWEGYTTDWLYDASVKKYYSLRNPTTGGRDTTATIIEYSEETNTETVIYKAPDLSKGSTEFWKIAKSGNVIAVMATDSERDVSGPEDLIGVPNPIEGSYDATEANNKSYIFFINLTDNSVSVRVSKTASLKAQIGHYFVMGQTLGDYRTLNIYTSALPQRPPMMLPDTRHSFRFYGNDVYYIFVDSMRVGVAKVGLTTPNVIVTSIPLDKAGNKGGIDFDIAGNKLFLVSTTKSDVKSATVISETDL